MTRECQTAVEQAKRRRVSLYPLALLLLSQIHANLHFSLYSCLNCSGCDSLSESRIIRGNAFPRLLDEYIVSHVSLKREIVAVRIRYVVLATRSIQ